MQRRRLCRRPSGCLAVQPWPRHWARDVTWHPVALHGHWHTGKLLARVPGAVLPATVRGLNSSQVQRAVREGWMAAVRGLIAVHVAAWHWLRRAAAGCRQ